MQDETIDNIILGNDKIKKFFARRLENDDFASAYLFAGPDGVGKKRLVDFLRDKLLPAQNLRVYSLFIDQGEDSITIADIRRVEENLSLKGVDGAKKIVVINNAHFMTPEAQNALLKTLEEPSGDALIILITGQPKMLLATVRSRCETIVFSPVSHAKIKQYLVDLGQDKKNSELIAELAGGSIGRARALAETKKNMDLDLVKRLLSSNISERFGIMKEDITSRRQARKLVQELILVLRLLIMGNLEQVDLKYVREFLGVDDKGFELDKLKTSIKWAQKIKKILYTNVNYRLALENLFLNL